MPDTPTPHLSWTVHRAREAPRRTAVVLAVILGFLVLTAWSFGPLLTLLAVVVLFAALNTYFLPVTYSFTDAGVEIDKRLFRTRYEWKQFRRWFRTTGGVVLSPFAQPSGLDNFRGVHLLLPQDPQPVFAYLERRFAPQSDNRLTLDNPSPNAPPSDRNDRSTLTSAQGVDNMDAKESS
ncbi:MAG: hypothetical protein ABIK86_03990 [candidate division WOR-3 bacterium]